MQTPELWPVLPSLVLVLALMAAVLALALCVGLGWAWRGQRRAAQAAQARAWLASQQLQAVQSLLSQQGMVLWRSDGAHHWAQPPKGWPGLAEPAGQAGPPWWEALPPEPAGLARGQALQEGAIGPLPFTRSDGTRADTETAGQTDTPPGLGGALGPEANWVLHGLPLRGPDGAFVGHLGLCRPQASAPETAAEPAAASEPQASPADAFSYTISHDLRSPLRVVEGFARILREDYGRLLDRIGNDHLERILSAASRMQHMIDALLALSKLSSGPLVRQAVDLSQQAGEVCEELRQSQPGRSVAVSIEPGLVVQADPTLTRIVLENLLGNAWKYTAKCERAEIRFTRHSQNPQGLTIEDNGAGFDMRFADRLFKPFQRLHSASDFKGHGIGLASVSRIVQRHGGRVWAESAVGQGTRMHLTLAPQAPSTAR
jgi:signal transduction histidine kinase